MNYSIIFSTSQSMKIPVSATDWLMPLLADWQQSDVCSDAIWLAEGKAAEIHLASTTPVDITIIRAKATIARIDVNIVPADNRRKRLLIADMDSTIITSESLDDLAFMVALGDEVAAITARSMAGKMNFEEAINARVAILTGQPTCLFDRLLAETTLTDGAVTLVKSMRARGAFCYLVSGGFDFAAAHIVTICGFHGYHANHMNVSDGKIDGTVRKPILGRDAKAAYLAHYCEKHDLTLADAATIGDGANDQAMLKAAAFGVAFNGKPLLREQVDLQLNYTDLTGLLYLQGYKDSEFVK